MWISYFEILFDYYLRHHQQICGISQQHKVDVRHQQNDDMFSLISASLYSSDCETPDVRCRMAIREGCHVLYILDIQNLHMEPHHRIFQISFQDKAQNVISFAELNP